VFRTVRVPRLSGPDYPGQVGILRPALHETLAERSRVH
jgi:hypothetical protein